MNCINEELIQRYIDGELDVSEDFSLQNHIKNCENCEEKLNRQVKIASGIKELIDNLVDENIDIPEFKIRTTREVKKGIVRSLFYDLSAAAVIVFFVGIQLFRMENVECERLMHYQFESDYDANLPITEQEINFEFINENGKLIVK